ncbi:MAG: sulfite oxidase [Nocardioides sp.]|nr:sulfite oxidase [Nocardioides sp.]
MLDNHPTRTPVPPAVTGETSGPSGESAPVRGRIHKALPPDRFIDHDTNAEMRWESVCTRDRLTAQSQLFVRNHTTTPLVRRDDYRLEVFGDGLVQRRGPRRALSFTLEDLQALPHTERVSVLECTGNGRGFFATQQGRSAPGTAWTLGAVGAVRWQGVLLRDLLGAVGLSPDAVSVQATGLDDPFVLDGVDHGRPRRPFPISKALDDALLAWGADGTDLLPDHGFPLRLLLPGWVGIASIKWLGSLEVSRTPLSSPWSTVFYRMSGGEYPVDTLPLTTNPVRSAWALPWEATLTAGVSALLQGRAWSGEAPITRVEVSLDGGRSWQWAVLGGDQDDVEGDDAWTRFSVRGASPAVGRHELMARATDAKGRTQPLVSPWNSEGYLFDAVVRHPVVVA